MVTDEQFDSWAAEHMRTFGIGGGDFGDRFLASMVRWRDEFRRRKYTFIELSLATQEIIALVPPPKYADGHLAAITKSVAVQREKTRESLSRAASVGMTGGPQTCITCGGYGVVIVPLLNSRPPEPPRKQTVWEPHHVNEIGDEIYLTMAVSCDAMPWCAARNCPGLKLSTYERMFREWETEKSRVESAQAAHRQNLRASHGVATASESWARHMAGVVSRAVGETGRPD